MSSKAYFAGPPVAGALLALPFPLLSPAVAAAAGVLATARTYIPTGT